LAVKPSIGALQAALARLDQLIGAAVERSPEIYGPAAARDSFRGLYLNREDFERLLARVPCEPLLWSGDEISDEAGGLAEQLGLSPFDLDVLLIALAPELDLKYERLFGFLQDDITRKRPSVDLALHLLCPTAGMRIERREHFSVGAPLLANHWVRLVADPAHLEPPLLAHYLKPEPQILGWFTGQASIDARLAPFCRLLTPELSWDDTVLDAAACQALARISLSARTEQRRLRLFFEGPQGAGQAEAAEALAREQGTRLLAVSFDSASDQRAEIESLLPAMFAEAKFHDALMFIDGVEAAPRVLVESLAGERGVAVVLCGARAFPGWFPVSFHAISAAASLRLWERSAAAEGFEMSRATAELLSARMKLRPGQIAQAGRTARWHAIWRGGEVEAADLLAASRLQSGSSLAALARRVVARHGWDDIVLPADTAAQLREMCQRVAQRQRVLDDWGFEDKLSMGKGVNALFAGPSGSGKTMAVEIISREIELDAYKIDLSGVVSKYIGETEKNLDRIFAAAENANAILFFDEADALFGKRSEVRDSHDRYANIEISYLLQKMEEYPGIAILATNMRQNLDEAFVRRLTFSVHFPFPDEDSRRRIWSGIWPEAVPLADDVNAAVLARRFKLSGGNIRNVALAAAFAAAEDGEPVSMGHLLHATRREYQKFGKQLQPGEMELAAPQVVT
jgi:SpoVK/Ycf46/Vps4 family AAA+-type ATPase